MTSRTLLALGVAGMAVSLAAPAAAQPEMTYEGSGYQYAVPMPQDYREPVAAPVIYQSHPVVQPIPADSYDDYDTEYEYQAGAPYAAPPEYPDYRSTDHADYRQAPEYPRFDREAWLDQCYANMRHQRDGRNGGVTGGVIGAIAGGVIGNRVADGDRLAGTLIGAGAGGLAGAAIGSAIDSADRKSDAREYCEAYLARSMAGGYGHHQSGQYYAGHPYAGHPYAGHHYAGQAHYGQVFYGQAYYPAPVMYVQVMVPVQRRAVVREYVEYVSEPVTVYEAVEVKEVVRHRQIAPATKTIPIKHAPQPTKYIKQD